MANDVIPKAADQPKLCDAMLIELADEVLRLRQSLQFYADASYNEWVEDHGAVAHAALATL